MSKCKECKYNDYCKVGHTKCDTCCYAPHLQNYFEPKKDSQWPEFSWNNELKVFEKRIR